MSRRGSIGFDRRLDLAWLDSAAAKAKDGASSEELRTSLWALLGEPGLEGQGESATKKTVTVLHRIWGPESGPTEDLRQRAMGLLEVCGPKERLGLHWAMMVARYPIFVDVAATLGRLLKLQDSVTLSLLNRRLAKDWGSRSTLHRAVQRIVRSMIQWGIIEDTGLKGVYRSHDAPIQLGPELSGLVVEAILHDSEAQAMPLDTLMAHPALFPFALNTGPIDLRNSVHLRFHREGLDSVIVELV